MPLSVFTHKGINILPDGGGGGVSVELVDFLKVSVAKPITNT